ncbi:MMPL family transporter [Spirillospora sp. NPDC048911]|uniref:MMPL family transporter n=1 Tax=Spirillospora sp. NPDC048911 TaxID=3364527 RepID=UPI0037223639
MLATALLLMAVLGLTALGLDRRLSNGGYVTAGTESVRADAVLARRFHISTADLVLRVTAGGRVESPEAIRTGVRLTRWIAAQVSVNGVQSYWTSGNAVLRSTDRRSALIQVDLSGDQARAARSAEDLVPRLAERARSLRVAATGYAWASVQTLRNVGQDLRRAELLTTPLLAVILLVAFRSAYGALLPSLIGGLTVVATMAVLRLTTHLTPVPVYAPNVMVGLGFGLAIDYSLFITTRFRDELSGGSTVDEALQRTMMTAGRTVLFSGLTVATATAALLAVPLGVVRSPAWATIVVVLMAATSTMLVQPVMLAAVGRRIDRGDPECWRPVRCWCCCSCSPAACWCRPRRWRWARSA